MDRYPPGWGDRPAGGIRSIIPVSPGVCFLMQEQKDDLIERVAARVAEGILADFPAEGVTVCLKNHGRRSPPTSPMWRWEITRWRES